jgi:glutathione S-transferase
MTLILHHVPDYASSIIRFALEEMALPYTVVLKDFVGGELGTAAYRKVNPAGLIPALETPDGPVFETAAILLWLTDRHAALSPQPQDPDRGAFLSWLVFTSNALHTAALAIVYPHRPAGEANRDAALAAAHGQVLARLGLIEAMIQDQRPRWLSPDHPGVLGYYIGMLMRWLAMTPAPYCIDAKAFPALHAVLAAHEARPAALRVAASDGLGPTPFTQPVF